MRSAVPKPEANRGTTAAKVVDGRVIDGAAGGSHHTGLYAFDAIAPRAYGLDAIGADAFRAYHEQGFIAVEKAFAPEQMTGVIEALEEQITDDDSGTVVQYEAWAAKKIEQLDNKERILAARKLTVFVASDPRLQDIAAHPAMLEIVSRLMGGRGSGAPPRDGTPQTSRRSRETVASRPRLFQRAPRRPDCRRVGSAR